MRNIIVIIVAVLIVLANYAAWNKAFASEYNTTRGAAYEAAVCMIALERDFSFNGNDTIEVLNAKQYWTQEMMNIAIANPTNTYVEFDIKKGNIDAWNMSIKDSKIEALICLSKYQLETM